MRDDPRQLRSRQLLILAVAASLLLTLWAHRTPPQANADRYDYLGRAHHVLTGEGPDPLVSYPLRFAFDDAGSLPPRNLSRPPLWPMLLAPPLSWGLADSAGVVVGALFLVGLLLLLQAATDRSLGAGSGGFAALVVVSSFATARALWGGGPELALTALTFLLWTWAPARAGWIGYLACGATYALLPWLHPIGWLYAGVAFLARSHRYSARGRIVVGAVALALGTPWYLHVGTLTGSPLGPLQSQAELARATLDPGGLGPYRGLDPMPTLEVLREHFTDWLRESRHRLRLHLTGLDAWIAWPVLALTLVGVRRDPRLALRDAILVGLCVLVVSAVSFEARLLMPLVPIVASWAGSGYRELTERRPRFGSPWVVALVLSAPWWLPLGTTLRPGEEIRGANRVPDDGELRLITEAARAGGPLFVDDARLAWRSRQACVLLPDRPATLERVADHLGAAPDGARVALARGLDSPWLAPHREEWMRWLDAPGDSVAGSPLRVFAPASADSVYVPKPLELGPADAPPILEEIPVPPASRPGLRLVPAAKEALLRMVEAAEKDGITLRVISAYRSYEYQEGLHGRAVERHGADQAWVAAPGTSEHQLGTTVDVADAAQQHALEPSFAQTPEGRWVREHAGEFGFVLSYTPDNADQTGYRPEPWHLRYLREDARP